MRDWARKDIRYGNEQQYSNNVAMCVLFFLVAPSTSHVRQFVGGLLSVFMKEQVTGEWMEQNRKPKDIREDIIKGRAS
jgi:hypothetical protein